MKIDWKYVATTEGYKSLKAAYAHDVQDAEKTRSKGRRPMRDKAEFLKKFKWVIARATHHADKLGVTLDVILDKWEKDRNSDGRYCWWLNHYSNLQAANKITGSCLKPMGVKGLKRYYKADSRYKDDPIRRKNLICRRIVDMQKNDSTRKSKKVRWSKDKKDTYKRFKEVEKSL